MYTLTSIIFRVEPKGESKFLAFPLFYQHLPVFFLSRNSTNRRDTIGEVKAIYTVNYNGVNAAESL